MRDGLDEVGDESLKFRWCTHKHTIFITRAGSRRLVRDRPQHDQLYVVQYVIYPDRGVFKPFPCEAKNALEKAELNLNDNIEQLM